MCVCVCVCMCVVVFNILEFKNTTSTSCYRITTCIHKFMVYKRRLNMEYCADCVCGGAFPFSHTHMAQIPLSATYMLVVFFCPAMN